MRRYPKSGTRQRQIQWQFHPDTEYSEVTDSTAFSRNNLLDTQGRNCMASLGGSRSQLGDTLNPATSAIATRTDPYKYRHSLFSQPESLDVLLRSTQVLNDDRNERVNDSRWAMAHLSIRSRPSCWGHLVWLARIFLVQVCQFGYEYPAWSSNTQHSCSWYGVPPSAHEALSTLDTQKPLFGDSATTLVLQYSYVVLMVFHVRPSLDSCLIRSTADPQRYLPFTAYTYGVRCTDTCTVFLHTPRAASTRFRPLTSHSAPVSNSELA